MNAPARIFEAKPAVRASVPLLIGLTGPSGGGKTFSALRLAKGIQSVTGGDIYGIDTEARRMLHYADRFSFRHLQFDAPFGSIDYLDAIKHCVAQGAGVVIVDSMSHEHEGPGGMIDAHDKELDRMAGGDWSKRERMNMLAWQKPKAARRALINGILQLNANFIFCFRAKNTAKPVRKDGKTEIVQQGFMPIAGEELVFEMTMNALLLPHADGVPTWQSENVGERMMMKLPDQFRDLLAEPRPLSEDIGAALATWARGGTPADEEQARAAAREAAVKGKDALQAHWKGLDQSTRRVVQPIMDELKEIAAKTAAPPEDGNRHPPADDGGGGSAVELPQSDQDTTTAVPAQLSADHRRKLRVFADALASTNTPAGVEKGASRFWSDNDLGDDEVVSPLAVAATEIVRAQSQRCRGELSVAEADAVTRKVLPL